MRVLQITSTSDMGGAEQMVLHMLRHADPTRLSLDILSLVGSGELTRRAREAGARAENWAVRHMADPRLPVRMGRFIKAGRYDLVQCYGLRAELVTRPAARILRRPLLSSIRSIDPWRRPYHVWLDRLSAGGVTAWVAVCEAARLSRIRRERFPAERIHTVLNGLPDRPRADEASRRVARERLGISPDAPVLAMVANLRTAKGYPDLIDALAALRASFPDLVCLCAGRDDSDGAIPAQAHERGLDGVMRWMGFVADPEPVLAAADAVVLSSHWEGCPVNLIEAMRAGRAIVATRVGGIPELISHEREGLLVPPQSPDALAAALERMLGDADARRTWADAARRRFERELTVERMMEQLMTIYERYALPPPRGGAA